VSVESGLASVVSGAGKLTRWDQPGGRNARLRPFVHRDWNQRYKHKVRWSWCC